MRLRRELVDLDRDAYLPDLAQSANTLANRLAKACRPEDGLPAAEESVEFYPELVNGNRDAYIADLAESVNTLALRSAEAGRLEEALLAARETIGYYRALAERYPAVFSTRAERTATLVGRLFNAS